MRQMITNLSDLNDWLVWADARFGDFKLNIPITRKYAFRCCFCRQQPSTRLSNTTHPTDLTKCYFHGVVGRGCGQVVSVLAYYSNHTSSNPADAYSFFCKICVWMNENKQKEVGVGPFFKKIINYRSFEGLLNLKVFN